MSSLYSSRWHRVAALRPRLVPALQVRRQRVRGERWVLLADARGRRSVRLNAAAHALVARFDGRHEVQALWQAAQSLPGDPPTQDEVIELLAQLREAGLIQLDQAADFEQLLHQRSPAVAPRRGGSLLAWRLPLFDPHRLLQRLQPLGRMLFSGPAAWACAAALLALLLLAVQHGPALWAHGQRWLATPRFAVIALLLYVPMKLLHELAHGLAVQRWGGASHEAGVTLMFGLPVPYVDASAAATFPRRRERVLVGAAGLLAELMLAALALPLWLWLDEGLARDVAFVTLCIAGVSTLLFNANPLQRLDGYYIATDLLGLPNLAPRSRRWWLGLLQRRLLGLRDAEPMPVARGEAGWLAAYAPLSWLYGLGIAAVALLWLGQLSLVLGVAGGLVVGWQLVLKPAWGLARQLRAAALVRTGAVRRWRRLAGAAVVLGLVALLLPLPQRVLVQGVVWPADDAQLRAAEDGFVSALQVADGAPVAAGAVVLVLHNPALEAQWQRQRARVEALETELFQALPGTGAGKGNAGAELDAAQAELARLEERRAGLLLRARSDGIVALPAAADLAGQFVKRGQWLGQVLGPQPATARLALPEAEALSLQHAAPRVSLRLASRPGERLAGTLLRHSDAANPQLPSAALSARHGGSIPTDPADDTDLRPLQPVVVVDVQLDAAASTGRRLIGERAWVRLDTGWAPLAVQAARAARRFVLSRFNAQF
jgi:putative peptide zinc metalloprotease protein